MHVVPAPFRFCFIAAWPTTALGEGDFAKLATLTSEGRSTATTILSLSTIKYLKGEHSLKEKARKLLSFTDNRQDASLRLGT